MNNGKWISRVGRLVLALVVGCSVWASSLTSAWARPPKADNAANMTTNGPDADVAAYMLVIGGLVVGVAVVCRRSYRSGEPK